MADDFVWAIDEDGKPTKCTAKPENRGKRNCKHRFHALPGQTQKEFFKQFMINNKKELTDNRKDFDENNLPDYSETITTLISPNNQAYSSWTEAIESNYRDYFNNRDDDGNIIGKAVEMRVVDECIDPNDPTSVLIRIDFEYDGEIYHQEISIPKVDEQNQLFINGVAYRSIPTFYRRKRGIVINDDLVIVKSNDRLGDAIAYIDKDTGIITMHGEIEIDRDEFMKCINGKKSNLSDEQKKVLSTIDPVALERLNKEGIDKLINLPKDAPNDITDRPVFVYEDRVNYTISKHMRSTASIFRKRRKSGAQQDFSLGKINEDIRKDLLSDSTIQVADNLNPIAALSQSERITFIGSGVSGFSRDAMNNMPELRGVHESYRGVVDTNDITHGRGIGTTVAVRGSIGKDFLIQKDDRITTSDFIPYIENSDPQRAIMAVAHMKQAVPLVGGEDPHVSTKGWDSIKGSKLGVNMNVVYMAEAGTYEDATVISESAAAKMATKQSKKYNLKNKPNRSYSVGDEILRGTHIGGAEIKYGGRIKSISENHLEIESYYPMTVGDKVAGRHGNKQIISKILPDDEMPVVNGKPVDMIMSPIGVSGRANLGQIYEINGGKTLDVKHRVEYQGRVTENAAGEQFVMRLNHIAEKKLSSASDEMTAGKEYKGGRFGEMENLMLTQSEGRLKILEYIKHQEHQYGEEKLLNHLKAIGVSVE